jgi:hypothetical protein
MYEVTDGKGSHRMGGSTKCTVPTGASGDRNVGGKLSAATRRSLPKSDFALPGRGTGPTGSGPGSYPIPDRSHAANALSRSSGKSVASAVKAKVCAKYPDMPSCK